MKVYLTLVGVRGQGRGPGCDRILRGGYWRSASKGGAVGEPQQLSVVVFGPQDCKLVSDGVGRWKPCRAHVFRRPHGPYCTQRNSITIGLQVVNKFDKK